MPMVFASAPPCHLTVLGDHLPIPSCLQGDLGLTLHWEVMTACKHNDDRIVMRSVKTAHCNSKNQVLYLAKQSIRQL
jgi:hypothetical protein